MERVNEAVSSDGPLRQGPTHTYRDSLEKPRSVPIQSRLGSVILCLASTRVVGFKVLRNFYVNCAESVQPL